MKRKLHVILALTLILSIVCSLCFAMPFSANAEAAEPYFDDFESDREGRFTNEYIGTAYTLGDGVVGEATINTERFANSTNHVLQVFSGSGSAARNFCVLGGEYVNPNYQQSKVSYKQFSKQTGTNNVPVSTFYYYYKDTNNYSGIRFYQGSNHITYLKIVLKREGYTTTSGGSTATESEVNISNYFCYRTLNASGGRIADIPMISTVCDYMKFEYEFKDANTVTVTITIYNDDGTVKEFTYPNTFDDAVSKITSNGAYTTTDDGTVLKGTNSADTFAGKTVKLQTSFTYNYGSVPRLYELNSTTQLTADESKEIFKAADIRYGNKAIQAPNSNSSSLTNAVYVDDYKVEYDANAVVLYNFQQTYAEQLKLDSTSLEAVFAEDYAKYIEEINKVKAAIAAYDAAPEVVKSAYADEYSIWQTILGKDTHYKAYFGETAVYDFEDGIIPEYEMEGETTKEKIYNGTDLSKPYTQTTKILLDKNTNNTTATMRLALRSYGAYETYTNKYGVKTVFYPGGKSNTNRYQTIEFDVLQVGSYIAYDYTDANNYRYITLGNPSSSCTIGNYVVENGTEVAKINYGAGTRKFPKENATSDTDYFNTSTSWIHIALSYEGDKITCVVSDPLDPTNKSVVMDLTDGTYAPYDTTAKASYAAPDFDKQFKFASISESGGDEYDNMAFTFKPNAESISTVNGAWLRKYAPNGIRFSAEYGTVRTGTQYTVSYGLLILPTNMVPEGELITADTASVYVQESTGTVPSNHYVALANIIGSDIVDREFTVRAYVKYTYANGKAVYEYAPTQVSRSVYSTAIRCAAVELDTEYTGGLEALNALEKAGLITFEEKTVND
ncbi:MAG: hypothetical protein II317_02345 [Clostridia bacterium]|nr:hypothetical protein [Clostridia bacterium]